MPTTPPSGVRRAMLMSNVGMHHRIGPFRLYVELARAMASEGWYALRFDHSGMGDSAPRADGVQLSEAADEDFADAMNFLRDTHGIEEFVIVGLCSGVDSAHTVSVRHPHVRGAVFIDGYSYPTLPYYLRRYTMRPFDLDRWKRYLERRISGDEHLKRRGDGGGEAFDRVYPPLEQFRRDIGSITQRGGNTFFIFTGTVDKSFNAERQLYEMLDSRTNKNRVAVTKLDSTDHIFTHLKPRADLIDRIRRWAQAIG